MRARSRWVSATYGRDRSITTPNASAALLACLPLALLTFLHHVHVRKRRRNQACAQLISSRRPIRCCDVERVGAARPRPSMKQLCLSALYAPAPGGASPAAVRHTGIHGPCSTGPLLPRFQSFSICAHKQRTTMRNRPASLGVSMQDRRIVGYKSGSSWKHMHS